MLKLAGELLEGRLADHEASLDAHMADLWQSLRAGEFYGFGQTQQDATGVIAADTLYAVPFRVPRATTWDRIALEVTAAVAGKSCRLGIYRDGTNLYPGALLLDAGTVSAATTGIKTITISQTPGTDVIWLVLVSDGTPTLRHRERFVNMMGFPSTSLRYATGGWSKGFTYAALPDPFPGGGSLVSVVSAGNIAMVLRLESLD